MLAINDGGGLSPICNLHTSDHVDSSMTGPLCLCTSNSPSRVMYFPGKYAINALDQGSLKVPIMEFFIKLIFEV